MARPCKPRRISSSPRATIYKPAGIPARELAWIEMSIDEYEALRLVDGEGLEQEAAAAELGVSRPTVSRILARGRGKLAQMLAAGAALVIEGGPVCLPEQRGRHGRGRGRGRWGWRGG